ncbi:MAG: polyprenyl diphosphate synthase [SAR202 cluster bacterium]|nr:polyprenyl diphosphate synthase [SAR202 cluster bacterium]MDP6663882.1 polyprenyl diphosphate synthase [SAR202 cluster bacterium]MDP6799657.1 polyprenyl diphosphate synthase [SAR202 cluster bacterium]
MTHRPESPTQQPGHEDFTRASETASSPTHVAIIMDGNGRWATSRGETRSNGHRAGTENVRQVVEAFARSGVEYLTLFAFSTENWDRPDQEVNALITILHETISREVADLHAQGIRIRHLGTLDRMSADLGTAISDGIELTKHNTRMTLSVAFNYGGRAEILDAVKRIVASGVGADRIDDELFASHLYTRDMPDPDLIIRTAGEMRLSNFLLWQSAYAEYYTTEVLWPDFDAEEVQRALDAYGKRSRRFGRVEQQRR